jgi:acyl-CoA hydrolase
VAQLDLGVDPAREFERKLVSAHQAAGLVESGDLVWIPSSHQPPATLAALAAREEELRDVTIRSVVIPNMGWFREDARKAWDLQVQYALAPDNRQALADRLVDFHPLHMINQHKAADTHRRADAGGDAAEPAGLRLRRQLGLGRGDERATGAQGDRRALAGPAARLR